jgi:hypothetical protein
MKVHHRVFIQKRAGNKFFEAIDDIMDNDVANYGDIYQSLANMLIIYAKQETQSVREPKNDEQYENNREHKIAQAFQKLVEEYQLTYGEITQILASQLTSIADSQIRQERGIEDNITIDEHDKEESSN